MGEEEQLQIKSKNANKIDYCARLPQSYSSLNLIWQKKLFVALQSFDTLLICGI